MSAREIASPGGLWLYLVDCAELCEVLEACERATPRLSEEERARFDRLAGTRGPDDARKWRAAHIALRIALEPLCEVSVRGEAFGYADSGRPFLARAPHFSLAHSEGLALIGIAEEEPIGVDIELERSVQVSTERRQRIEGAAAAFGAAQPLPQAGDARFLQAWVRLESVAKATGLGIGRVLTESGATGNGRMARDFQLSVDVDVRDLDIGLGRFAAVAARGLPPVVVIQPFPATLQAISAFLGARGPMTASEQR